jgi:hypothetical protein
VLLQCPGQDGWSVLQQQQQNEQQQQQQRNNSSSLAALDQTRTTNQLMHRHIYMAQTATVQTLLKGAAHPRTV